MLSVLRRVPRSKGLSRRIKPALLPVSDQVNQHHDEDGEQHGDGEEIAEDFDADLAAGHSVSGFNDLWILLGRGQTELEPKGMSKR